jgi:CRISPR/Cas system CSM-associated protein Csm3 (group 7 of RAMP superfamily)
MKNSTKSQKKIDEKKLVITDSDLVFINGDKDTLLSRCLIKISKLKGKIRQLFEKNKAL